MSEIDKWRGEAMALPEGEVELRVPLDVLLGEAVDVAKVHGRYWKAQRDGAEIVLPGIELAVGAGAHKKPLSAKTGKEILSLAAAVREADVAYHLALTPPARAPSAEGRALFAELSDVLEWAFDDGVDDARDRQLDNLDARYGEPTSQDALASALEAYADLADQVRELLATFETFELSTIERAREVAAQLRAAPQSPTTPNEEAAAALALRNRLARLLLARMQLVRSAMALVFRKHPEIRREAASTYERKRKAATRRAQREAEAKQAEEAPKPQGGAT